MEIESIIASLEKKTLPKPTMQKKWGEIMNAMRVHTQGEGADKLLRQRHNEAEHIFRARKEMFVPITKQVVNRGIGNISRIIQNSTEKPKGSNTLNKILESESFEGQDFFAYFTSRVIPAMIEDPNGVLAWYPVLSEEDIKADENGNLERTGAGELRVQPYIFHSDKITYWDAKSFVGKTNEKSIVTVGSAQKYEGEVYFVFTEGAFYRVEQFGEQHLNRFQLAEPPYVYRFEDLPISVLGGNWNTNGYYESFFSGFVDIGNEAIRQYSDYQAILITCAYPIRQMSVYDCDAPGCNKGTIYDQDGTTHKCPNCDGTGFKFPSGPNSVLLKPVVGGLIDQPTTTEDLLKYISPDVGVMQHSKEAWQTNLAQCEKSLGLLNIDQAQSGTAKEVDREQLYALLSSIGLNVYSNLIYASCYAIESYYNPIDPVKPSVTPPSTFRTKTEAELMQELNQLGVTGRADSLVISTLKNLTAQQSGGDPVEIGKVNFSARFDPLYPKSINDKQVLLNSNIVTLQQVQSSTYLYAALEDAIQRLGEDWFVDASYDEIAGEVNAYIQPRLTAPPAAQAAINNLP